MFNYLKLDTSLGCYSFKFCSIKISYYLLWLLLFTDRWEYEKLLRDVLFYFAIGELNYLIYLSMDSAEMYKFLICDYKFDYYLPESLLLWLSKENC